MELEGAAGRAVDAALGAGAGDAEAYAVEDAGREVRVHGGKVESLTAATERGVGVRAWSEGRVGYAYGTDLSDAGLERVAARAADASRTADTDEFAAPPAAPGRRRGDRGPQRSRGRGGRRRRGRGARPRGRAGGARRRPARGRGRAGRLRRQLRAGRDPLLDRDRGWVSRPRAATPSCRPWRRARAAARPGSASAWRGAPAVSIPSEIGREAAQRAVSMIGARKPESRACPVVLDPTVAASFAGLIGSTLGADSVQRGRSPFASATRRGGRQPDAALRGRRPRPRRPRLLAVRRRGRPPPPHRADRGRSPAHLSARHLHGPPGRHRIHLQRRARRLPLDPLGGGVEPADRRGRTRASTASSPPHRRVSTSPTSPAFTRG